MLPGERMKTEMKKEIRYSPQSEIQHAVKYEMYSVHVYTVSVMNYVGKYSGFRVLDFQIRLLAH